VFVRQKAQSMFSRARAGVNKATTMANDGRQAIGNVIGKGGTEANAVLGKVKAFLPNGGLNPSKLNPHSMIGGKGGIQRNPTNQIGGKGGTQDDIGGKGGTQDSGNIGGKGGTQDPVIPGPGDDTSLVKGGVTDATEDLGKKVLSGVAPKALSALGVAGDVFDALGPIGDLIGLGMSIFGGVEAHKATEAKAAAAKAAQTAQDAAQASINKPPAVRGSGATLNTAKVQPVANVHF